MFTGNIKSKNYVHWADYNPHDVVAHPLHEEKVTVRCGKRSTFILGTYFFEDFTAAVLKTCTVRSARYLETLTNYVIHNFQQRNPLSNVVGMQDGPFPQVGSPVKIS